MTDNKDRFKFRFFEKKTKRLFQWDDIVIEKDRVLIINDNSYLGRYVSFDDGDLIQCTGVKDKNGKLIYEGDIIKTPLLHDTYYDYAYYEIVWCNKGARLYQKCVGLHHKTNGWIEVRNIVADEWDYDSFEYYMNKNIKIEIIGNIFKNPELLKK